MKISLKQILALTALCFLILFISCKKIGSNQEEVSSTTNDITNKFFNTNRTSDPKEAALVNYLKNRNNKENFVEGIVSRIGYPRWDKAFQFPNKVKSNTSTNLVGDSTSIYHIPFVRDSQNFVNASMILLANQTDTSISYKCDWQYSQKQNSIQSYSDSAEYFAVYFMILDKTVFGYNKFNIIDSNLFRSTNHHTKQVTLNSFTTNTTNSLLAWVTTCQDVTISWNDCPYAVCTGENGSCDGCPQCTSSVSWTYCSSGWQETGGGGGGGTGGGGTGGGGTGGGGSGGGGGDPNPPNCNTPSTPVERGNSQANNIIEPCSGNGGGGGWNPIPPILVQHLEGHENTASHPDNWDIQTFAQDTLPSWNQYYSNYPKDSTTGCELDPAAVYAMAGGPLYNSHLNDPDNYANACALRTSIALTKCGKNIPLIRELNPDGTYRNVTRLGANGKYYFITASDLYWWMIKTFGTPPPSHVVLKTEALDGIFASKLPLEKGIYIMRAKNSSATTGFGATGHVSPFDNGNPFPCGHLYGNNEDVGGGINNVSLWKLN